MSTPANPPAFPVLEELMPYTDEHGERGFTVVAADGMSLRDYFAGQALYGVLQWGEYLPAPDKAAAAAYLQADAMLKAREAQ